MSRKIPAKLLQQIYHALSEKNRRFGDFAQYAPLDDIIVARGWVYNIELEELLFATDSRVTHLDLNRLTEYLEIPWRTVYKRPRYLSAGAVATNALTLADAACLFVRMEEMGFDSHPERLVEHGLRAQKDLTHITDSEWTLLSYPKRRLKEEFYAQSDGQNDDGEWTPHNWKDALGRRIEFTLVGTLPHLLTVRGPRYRRPAPQVSTTCPTCGCRYTKGDPEGALFHRSEHARVMRFMNPRPLTAFQTRLEKHADPELVIADSPIWMHREIHQRALQFKREFQYDFLQWEGSLRKKNLRPESHGYLFADHTDTYGPGAAIGACAFWHEDEKWRMRWIWVCPSMRRSGVLAKRWAEFLHRYGDFEIDTPLSEAMAAFVNKHGTAKQKQYLLAQPPTESLDL